MVRRYVWHCDVRRLDAKRVTLPSPVEATGGRKEPALPGWSGWRLGKGLRTQEVARDARSGREKSAIHKMRGVTPNDPKLSDSGVRRGTCMAGGKAVAEAGAVTHGAVRWSAWLGVAIWVGSSAKGRPNVEKLPPVAVTCAQKRRATPDKLSWVLKELTKGLRGAKGEDAPGTDARCEEQRWERQKTA